jgi:acetyl esterase/lipase
MRSEPGPERHLYGSDPSQFGDLYRPAERSRGTVVLIHGGWWRSAFGSDYLGAIADDLARRDWTTWNIEYRRVGGGGGYPETLEDVATAIDFLERLDTVDRARVITVGHSAGGHLATWAAGRDKLSSGMPGAHPTAAIRAVISLAGVVDLQEAARTAIGSGAAAEFIGGGPEEYPDRYAVADPLGAVPIGAAVRCIHGRDDDAVPIAQSLAYVEAARRAGGDAELLAVDGDHLSVTDISSPAWSTVIAALDDLTVAA